MNNTALGKVSLVLALFGAVGMGFGIATALRKPATGENGNRPKVEVPTKSVEEAVAVVPENKDTLPIEPVKTESPAKPVETRQAAISPVRDTDIIGRMLANEKRLGDALYVLRRDFKAFYDTVDMRLARMEAKGVANSARVPAERVEKSVAARRALEGYLNR